MSILSDLQTLITKEGTLTNNKVSNFSYDSYAYEHDLADGVQTYASENHNNIPVNDPSVIKTNATVVTKGFRSQVSTLPRMLINHIFGRVSYNLNKTVDVLNSLLSSLSSNVGAPNGIASLDSSGRIPYSQLPESAVELKGYWNASTNTPTLADGTGDNGDEYFVDVAGEQDLGSGSQYFKVGDRVVYSGGIWKNIDSGAVRSVDNVVPDAQGNVPLTGTNIPVSADYNTSLTERLQDTFINGAYSGRELKQALGKSTVSEVMQDLIARRKAHNYRGVGIGDHLTLPSLTVDGTAVENKATVQIAGFDQYKGKSMVKENDGSLVFSTPAQFEIITNNLAIDSAGNVFSTSDGGNTFSKVGHIGTFTGIIDLAYSDMYYLVVRTGADSFEIRVSATGASWSVAQNGAFSGIISVTKIKTAYSGGTYNFYMFDLNQYNNQQYHLCSVSSGTVTVGSGVSMSIGVGFTAYIIDFAELYNAKAFITRSTNYVSLYIFDATEYEWNNKGSYSCSLDYNDCSIGFIGGYNGVASDKKADFCIITPDTVVLRQAVPYAGTGGGSSTTLASGTNIARGKALTTAIFIAGVLNNGSIDIYEGSVSNLPTTPSYTATAPDTLNNITCIGNLATVLIGADSTESSNIYKCSSSSPYVLTRVFQNLPDEMVKTDICVANNVKLIVANKIIYKGTTGDLTKIAITGNFNSVCYGNSLYVAVGDNGLILKSSDATSWTDVSVSAVTSDLLFVRYINGLFIAVGANGTILTSTDATSWTLRTTGVVASLFSVCYGDGAYVVTGEDGTILHSADATSWSSKVSGVLVDLKRGVYVQKTFLVIGENNTVIQSADGEDWATKTIEGLDFDIADICASDIYCAIAGENTVLISQDLNYWNKFTNVKFSDNASAEITKINEGVTEAGDETFYVCGTDSIELLKLSAVIANNSESIVLLIDTHTIVDVSDLDAVVDIDDVATALGISTTDIPFVKRVNISNQARQHFFVDSNEVFGKLEPTHATNHFPLFMIQPSERCKEDSWYALGYDINPDGTCTSDTIPSDSRLVFLVTL